MPMLNLPLIIEPHDLLPHLDNKKLLVVDLSNEQTYLDGHVPGAIHIPPQAIVAGTSPAPGELPNIERLNQLFSQLGLRADTHVVAYDDEGGGWAGRFLWTLDMVSHKYYSYINGGTVAWRNTNMPLSTKTAAEELRSINSTKVSVTIDTTAAMSMEEILKSLNNSNFLVWDARSPEEYAGTKTTARKNGHIPGAIHCEWTELMDPAKDLRIREDVREYLASKGITKGKNIVTHCQSHHRSGFTYLIGKLLGFNICAYPGSWSEWGNADDTPVETQP